MLSPSDFNNAVPQFTNGNYASNPINPQYIAEPDAVSYNRGTEPLQTLPAQWWNWFLNKFTGRFNKVNVYVKNIFNELAQVLSIFNITPDGTEQTPTTSQLKTVFECCYPEYVKTAASLVGTETTVNGHPLSSNVTVTRSDLGLGTSATVNTGTAVGCIPTVGTALGTTNNNILVTDASGNLKPSGITVGTAAGCDATAFRSSSWTPTVVECANKGKNGSSYSAFGSNAFNSTAFTTCTGTVTKVKVGSTEYSPSSGVVSLPAYPSAPLIVCCAKCNGSGVAFGTAATVNTGTAASCIPTIGTALGTTNGQFVATDASGKLKPSGYSAGSFRASTWTPSCVACAGQSYCVMDYYANTTPLYIGYSGAGLTCAQVTHLAAFSANYTTGKTVIKDVAKGTIQSWLGLGSAAYCSTGCFRSSSWYPTCVACSNCACCARGHVFTDCLVVCHDCGVGSSAYGCMCLCNKSSCPLRAVLRYTCTSYRYDNNNCYDEVRNCAICCNAVLCKFPRLYDWLIRDSVLIAPEAKIKLGYGQACCFPIGCTIDSVLYFW